jgi:hypothetical protein
MLSAGPHVFSAAMQGVVRGGSARCFNMQVIQGVGMSANVVELQIASSQRAHSSTGSLPATDEINQMATKLSL